MVVRLLISCLFVGRPHGLGPSKVVCLFVVVVVFCNVVDIVVDIVVVNVVDIVVDIVIIVVIVVVVVVVVVIVVIVVDIVDLFCC